MGALAHKRAAVVPIEVARRRLRPELSLAPKSSPAVSRSKALGVVLAAATLVILALAVFGMRVAFAYVDRGSYWAAVMLPWMILAPAITLMFLLLTSRRRPATRPFPQSVKPAPKKISSSPRTRSYQ